MRFGHEEGTSVFAFVFAFFVIAIARRPSYCVASSLTRGSSLAGMASPSDT